MADSYQRRLPSTSGVSSAATLSSWNGLKFVTGRVEVQRQVFIDIGFGRPAARLAPISSESFRIASLARPGGNLTGVTRTPGPDVYSKALGLLVEASPVIKRPAFLAPKEAIIAFNATFRPAGVTIVSAQADTAEQIDVALATILRERSNALLVPSGPIFLQSAKRIGEFAATNKLPGIFGMRQSAEAGGLMSYGPSIVTLYRQMAAQADRILRGRGLRIFRRSSQPHSN